jgi:hypothetical protein
MELKQTVFLKGFRQVSFVNDMSIRLTIKELGKTQEFTVPLSIINDSISRVKSFIVSYLIASIVFLLLSIGFFLLPFFEKFDDAMITGVVFGIIFGSPVIYTAYKLYITSYDYDVFYNKYDGNVIFTLYRNKPNAIVYEEFIKAFIAQVNGKQTGESDQKTISNYITAIHDLRQIGVFNESEKNDILSRINEIFQKEEKDKAESVH